MITLKRILDGYYGARAQGCAADHFAVFRSCNFFIPFHSLNSSLDKRVPQVHAFIA